MVPIAKSNLLEAGERSLGGKCIQESKGLPPLIVNVDHTFEMRSVSYGVYISTSFASLSSMANAESPHVENGKEVKNPLYVYARRTRRSSQIVHNNFRWARVRKRKKTEVRK